MLKIIAKCALISSLIISNVVLAEETATYHSTKKADGSTVTEYTSSDGIKIKQVQYPSGKVETYATDGQGMTTISVQNPDGTTETKTMQESE